MPIRKGDYQGPSILERGLIREGAYQGGIRLIRGGAY